jgi:hypothetical protein
LWLMVRIGIFAGIIVISGSLIYREGCLFPDRSADSMGNN